MEHQLTIYNTLDRKKELFAKLPAAHLGMVTRTWDMHVLPLLSTCFSATLPIWDIRYVMSATSPM